MRSGNADRRDLHAEITGLAHYRHRGQPRHATDRDGRRREDPNLAGLLRNHDRHLRDAQQAVNQVQAENSENEEDEAIEEGIA